MNTELQSIQRANELFRAGEYESALSAYKKLTRVDSALARSININISLCERKIGSKPRPGQNAPTVASAGPAKEPQLKRIVCDGGVRPSYKHASEDAIDLRKAFKDLHGGHPMYFPPAEKPVVSIIIPVYRGREDLENCLRSLSLHANSEPSFEVIALDDCPDERVLWAIPQSGGLLRLVNEENLGFLRNCNKGASYARGEYLCFLNSDTLVSAGWLSSLVECHRQNDNVGLVGGMLLNNDGTIQDAGWRIQRNGWGHPIGKNRRVTEGEFTYRRDVDCVTGASFIVARELFNDMGGFDDHYAPAFYEEFDLAFRARERGLRTIYEPRSRVIHLGSASYGAERRDQLSSQNHAKFCKRFSHLLPQQPEYIEDDLLIFMTPPGQKTALIVDFDIPQPDRHAGDVTMFRYIKAIISCGIKVILAPANGTTEGIHAENLEAMGVQIHRDADGLPDWLARNGDALDFVMLARPEITTRLLPAVRQSTRAKILYYTHDLHFVRLEKEAAVTGNSAAAAEASRVKALETDIFRSVDVVVSPSASESALIQELVHGVDVFTLPPYFYSDSEIRSFDAAHFDGLHDILFVGGFPHTPNVDAALFIANEIMPLVWARHVNCRLILVGYAPPIEIRELASERIIVTGQVPAVEPYYDTARAAICALRYGAGVKGKTIDAMRSGLPVVATPIGTEGIAIENNIHAVVRDTPAELADAICELLRDTHRCAALSSAGCDLIRSNYSEAIAVQCIDGLFQ